MSGAGLSRRELLAGLFGRAAARAADPRPAAAPGPGVVDAASAASMVAGPPSAPVGVPRPEGGHGAAGALPIVRYDHRRTAPAAPSAPAPDPTRFAVIDPRRCVSFCAVCQERCPVLGAITFDLRRAALQVHPLRCDGCGLCAEVCPSPQKAVTLRARDCG